MSFYLIPFLVAAGIAVGQPLQLNSGTPQMLLPGSPELVSAGFAEIATNYRVIADASPGQAPRAPFRGHSEVRHTDYDGVPAYAVTFSFEASSVPGGFSDTAIVTRDGLAPRYEIQHWSGGTTIIKYDGPRISRRVISPDSLRSSAEHTYDVPVFGFAQLDQLVRAMPFKAGYHVIVPLYSEVDDSLERDTVDVRGQGPDGMWNIRFADKVIIGSYAIDPVTRRIERHDVIRHAGGPHMHYLIESEKPVSEPGDPASVADSTREQAERVMSVGAAMAVEAHWGEAENHGEVKYLEKLLLPAYRSVGPTGMVHTRDALLATARARMDPGASAKAVADSAAYVTAHPFRTSIVLAGNTAVVTYYSIRLGPEKGIMGSDVLVFMDGQWHALYSQHSSAQ